MNRRRFLTFAAPAIVAAPSLMKLSTLAATLIKPEPLMYFPHRVYSVTEASWYAGYDAATFRALIADITGITDLHRGLSPNSSAS